MEQVVHEEMKPTNRPTTSYYDSPRNILLPVSQESSVLFTEDENVSNESMLRPSTSYNASKPSSGSPRRKTSGMKKMSPALIMMQDNAINESEENQSQSSISEQQEVIYVEEEEAKGGNDKKASLKKLNNEMQIYEGSDDDDEVCIVEMS
jgi:hypothetical protein